MRQNRALGPDIATFTCAWMYQSLFSLCNNPPPGSFHHLPPLPPALLATRREDGEIGPRLGKSLTSHCHLAKSTSSAPFVTRVTQVGTPELLAATAGLCSPSSREVIHSNSTALNTAETLGWLQAIKLSPLSMEIRRQISHLLSSG